MSQISDLEQEVLIKCENRTTDTARADAWLRDALLEIAGNTDLRDDFDQLEVIGPFFNLSLNVQEYPEGNFLPMGDFNTATLDIRLWLDPPNNTKWRKLTTTHYQESDKYTNVPSQPVSWYRFGDNIGFNPTPDKTYQTQARFLLTHPIASPISQTTILLPNDWNEILVIAAVEKGFLELLEYEKADKIHKLLYGDPKYPTKPGMINGRKKRRAQEAWRDNQTQCLRPIVGRYSWR